MERIQITNIPETRSGIKTILTANAIVRTGGLRPNPEWIEATTDVLARYRNDPAEFRQMLDWSIPWGWQPQSWEKIT